MTSPSLSLSSPWGRLYRKPGTSENNYLTIEQVKEGLTNQELVPSVTNISGISSGDSGSLYGWHGYEAAKATLVAQQAHHGASLLTNQEILTQLHAGNITIDQAQQLIRVSPYAAKLCLQGDIPIENVKAISDGIVDAITRCLKGDISVPEARDFIRRLCSSDLIALNEIAAAPSAWRSMQQGKITEAELEAKKAIAAETLLTGTQGIGLFDAPATTLSSALAGSAARSAKLAADTGTAIHAIAEEYAKGIPRGKHGIPVTPSMEMFLESLHSFLDAASPNYLHTEITCFGNTANDIPLHYAGTADAIASFDGKVILLDYKTKKKKSYKKVAGNYPENRRQLAALAATHSFVTQDSQKESQLTEMPEIDAVAGVYLLDDGTWEMKQYEILNVSDDLAQFYARRQLWETDIQAMLRSAH